jgi:HEPN domain-containing protein
MNKDHEHWLIRAESALSLGKTGKIEDIVYEDLCFQLQQACEKVLKAFLVFYKIAPPKTHSFKVLLKLIKEIAEIPEFVRKVIDLEDYAVQTRYPGDYAPVT